MVALSFFFFDNLGEKKSVPLRRQVLHVLKILRHTGWKPPLWGKGKNRQISIDRWERVEPRWRNSMKGTGSWKPYAVCGRAWGRERERVDSMTTITSAHCVPPMLQVFYASSHLIRTQNTWNTAPVCQTRQLKRKREDTEHPPGHPAKKRYSKDVNPGPGA